MKNILKRYWVFAVLVLGGLAGFAVDIDIFADNQQAEPQGIADIPECEDTATFKGWVLLSYAAEVHAPQGLPSGYTAIIKTPFFLVQTTPISFKDSDATILGKLKSPWPDQFLIGQILQDYSLTRKYCKESPEQPQDKPVSKKPSKQLSEYMEGRKTVLPPDVEDKEYWESRLLENQK